jgi:hypothetical protein
MREQLCHQPAARIRIEAAFCIRSTAYVTKSTIMRHTVHHVLSTEYRFELLQLLLCCIRLYSTW